MEESQQENFAAEVTPHDAVRREEPALPEITPAVADGGVETMPERTESPVSDRGSNARSSGNRKKRDRNRVEQKGKAKRTGSTAKPIDRFVVVTWSGAREPVDTMFWAEARREGEWVVIESLEQIRTRREVLERITELPAGLVALEFTFSYPTQFLEFLSQELGDDRWRALLRKVRDDLKKNTEDGIRLWIDRIGQYREAFLDPTAPPVGHRNDDRRGGSRFQPRSRELAPHEQRSKAERFRRTDLTIRHAADHHVVSPVQIAFNRLTGRYEFNDPAARGRAALLGMSFLEQLLEAREDAAVWPYMMPKPLTVVELQPWIYTRGTVLDADETRRRLQVLEDAGWEIPSFARDLAARNPDAQRALLSLIGVIRTESREDRANRPLRDYTEAFYADQQVKQEGWFYGVGYRSFEEKKSSTGKADIAGKPTAEGKPKRERAPKQERTTEAAGEAGESVEETTSTADNPIANEASADAIEATPHINTGDPGNADVQAA